MISYKTNIQSTPPPMRQFAADARERLSVSPYDGQNHQDVFRAAGTQQAANLDSYARSAQQQYDNAVQQRQQQAALAGLNQMSQAQNQQRQLQDARLQLLLGGLL